MQTTRSRATRVYTHQAQLDVTVDDLLRQEEILVEILQVEERERWVVGGGGVGRKVGWQFSRTQKQQRSVTANGRKTQLKLEGLMKRDGWRGKIK